VNIDLMDVESPDPRHRKRVDLVEMYDTAIAELRSLHDPGVANLIERLMDHRRLIGAGRRLTLLSR
jgi:hypothetical protein